MVAAGGVRRPVVPIIRGGHDSFRRRRGLLAIIAAGGMCPGGGTPSRNAASTQRPYSMTPHRKRLGTRLPGSPRLQTEGCQRGPVGMLLVVPSARSVREAEREQSDYYWDAISSDTMLERMDYSTIFFRIITGFVASPRVREYWPIPWAVVLFFGLEAAILQGLETLYQIEMTDLQFLKGFTAVQQILTAPLGFLVVFRANQAYNRWVEARVTVGSILTTVNEMGQYAAATVRTEEELCEILTLLSAFTLAFQNTFDPLADTEQEAELKRLLGEEMYGVVAPAVVDGQMTGHRETAESLIQVAVQQLIDCLTSGNTPGVSTNMSGKILQGLERCHSLATSPISRSYTVQLRYLLFVFLLSVPTYLVDNVDSWLVVPDTMVISSAFLGIDLMSTMISNPFGADPEDLPLGCYAAESRARLTRILTTRQKMEHIANWKSNV